MQIPEITYSSDFQRRALVTILGIAIIVGAFWVVTRPADTFNSTDFSDNKILATPGVNVGRKDSCVKINTPIWGHPETFDPTLPQMNTPSDIFAALGVVVGQEYNVSVVQGDEVKPYRAGDVFANGSCFYIDE